MEDSTHSIFGDNAEVESVTARQIADREIVVLRSDFPSGVSDYLLHCKVDEQTIRILNPLELLGTEMAVRLLKRLGKQSKEIAAQVSLSRLLVQCLEYRGNSRHLIVEPWNDSDLRGETLFESNRTELARDCSVAQAERYQLILAGTEEPPLPPEHLYWGTFSTLPRVEDTFDDPSVSSFALQWLTKIEGDGVGDATIEIGPLRSLVKQQWRENFDDFELGIPKRERRPLFKMLMSAAVRQSSSFMRQIAYALVISGLEPHAQRSFELNVREEKLFAIRYGSYRPLGNINVGFLYDYDDLHADLLNELTRSLVSNESDDLLSEAETNLYRHVQLLGEVRDLRRHIRAEQRHSTRLSTAHKVPKPKVQAAGQEDASAPRPDQKLMAIEKLNELKKLLPRLKTRDRERVEALINTGGDKAAAAELLETERTAFLRRYRQTTQKNVRAAAEEMNRENENRSEDG